MLIRFSQQHEAGRFQPGVDLIAGTQEGCWRIVNAWTGYNAKEFMNAGPSDRPSGRPLGKIRKMASGGRMKWRVFAMRVDQDVCVNGNQERPS
jgi:hypothetical protein